MVGLIAATGPGVVEWHDVECGSYGADLPLWRELAAAAGGAVLDIGCGSGRVALDLALNGNQVMGVDSEPALVAALATRAREHIVRDLPPYEGANPARVDASVADARSLSLGRRFSLAIAPMQVAQLLGGPDGRQAMLQSAKEHLEPGALLAIALADPFEGFDPEAALPPLPDVLELDGWVLSSAPIAVRTNANAVEIDRHRQAVSPTGDLSEEIATISLDSLDAETLEAEARAVRYAVLERCQVPETSDHVGSTVVVLQC